MPRAHDWGEDDGPLHHAWSGIKIRINIPAPMIRILLVEHQAFLISGDGRPLFPANCNEPNGPNTMPWIPRPSMVSTSTEVARQGSCCGPLTRGFQSGATCQRSGPGAELHRDASSAAPAQRSRNFSIVP